MERTNREDLLIACSAVGRTLTLIGIVGKGVREVINYMSGK